MKKWIYACVTITLLSLFSSAWAKSHSDSHAAEQVIQHWFAAMKNKQTSQAASYLAPQFISIHTDGIVRDKAQEVALIKSLDMKSYHLSHFKFAQSGDTVTVTYKDDGVEKIDNKPIAEQAAGRMAVLQKQNSKWVIIAYANLDQIGQPTQTN